MSYVLRAVALAAALTALAVCSGDPEVREPDPTPSASQPDPSATPPSKPEVLAESSDSAAATFALYWVNVSDYAAVTGDVRELERISSPDCAACSDYIELYRETWAAGGYFRGGKQTLDDVSVRRDGKRKVYVYATVISEDGEFRTSSGAEIKKEGGGTNKVIFSTDFASGRWVMTHQALEGEQ